MTRNTLKNIGLICLLGIAIFSMIKYTSELKARFALQDELVLAQSQITALAKEKQNLLQENRNLMQDIEKEKTLKEQLELKNTNLKDYLRASNNRITRLFHDNSKLKNDLENVGTRFSVLKAENKSLIETHERIYTENEQFKSKLSSVVELKKAIRELKSGKRKKFDLTAEGNQGYLFKDGNWTALKKVKIEVVPAQTQK